jgi:hypothetical protein
VKRSGPLRRTGALSRGKGPKRSPFRQKPAKRRTPEGPISFQELALHLWRRARGRSELSGEPIPLLRATNVHHIIRRESLRQAGLHKRINDPRNGMLLTEEEHAAHESGARRIPREKIPEGAWEFARELGLI